MYSSGGNFEEPRFILSPCRSVVGRLRNFFREIQLVLGVRKRLPQRFVLSFGGKHRTKRPLLFSSTRLTLNQRREETRPFDQSFRKSVFFLPFAEPIFLSCGYIRLPTASSSVNVSVWHSQWYCCVQLENHSLSHSVAT